MKRFGNVQNKKNALNFEQLDYLWSYLQ